MSLTTPKFCRNICIAFSPESGIFFSRSLRGVAIQELRPSKLQRVLNIPLPPLEEQERIVAEIKSEEQAVAECRELEKKMAEKIAATLAKVWGEKK